MDDETPEQREAAAYLRSLLNKTLRIHTPDSRVFVGEFKCTDADKNVILANTYEYRIPTASDAVTALRSQQQQQQPPSPQTAPPAPPVSSQKLLVDITPRFLGLVVVPGQHIVRIELEEFASQVRGGAAGSDSASGVGVGVGGGSSSGMPAFGAGGPRPISGAGAGTGVMADAAGNRFPLVPGMNVSVETRVERREGV